MPNLTRKLLVISLLAPTLSCHAEDLANLSNEPLFLSSNVRGMLMLILGRDHTLASAAYNDAVSLTGSSAIVSSDTRFNPGNEYYGYFDPFKCYTYDTTNKKFSPNSNISSLASTDCGGDKWSGNFLNYVTTSRMDALRKALYGGMRSTDNDKATTLELSYVPADGHSWAKSYDPYDPAQLIGSSHAFPINKFTPFSKDDKIFFGRVNIRGSSASTPNLRVLNLTTIKNTGCSIYNQAGFSALSDNDYKNMRPRHWTGSGTPVTDIFLVKPSDASICIIDFNDRANNYKGAVSDFTLKVDVCVDGKINNQNKEDCVKYPGGNYKPTGILQTYKDKADFGLITGSYDQHLSGGVLRRNIADFNTEVDKDTGVFKLANSAGSGVGIVDTLNKIKIAKFNMTSGQFDQKKNPWVFWSTTNALNYDSCNLTDFNYVLNTSNSFCHDWGNPIGEMLAESMRYFYERKATPTGTFTTNDSVDKTLNLSKEDWLDPFADTTLTSDKKARPYCTPAYNLIISNNNVNFDTDNIPKIGDLSDWSSFADTIGTQESLNEKKFIIGTLLTDSNKTGAPTAKKLDKLSNVRGTPSEPTKQGSYASAGIAYWANLNNIYTGKTKPSRVRTMAIAMAAPIPDINIQMKDAKGNKRNITLVPTAKSVRKWQYMDNGNSVWDSATAEKSPIKYDSANTQPSNEIIDFSVDEISPTAGKFTVSFADVEQGGDNEADMTATYKYQVSGQTLTVTIISEYASGDIEQHAGYVLSGVSSSADGLYLDVRDIPSQGFGGYRSYGAEGDTLYYLDTPNTASNAVRGSSTTLLKPNFDGWYFRGSTNNWGKKYHSRMVPQGQGNFCTIQSFEDENKDNNAFKISHKSNPDDQNELYPVNNWTLDKGVYKVCINVFNINDSNKGIWVMRLADVEDWDKVSALNMVISEADRTDRTVTRTFTLGDASDTAFLKPPLWYAAKWGSFNSTPNDLATDNVTEPDLTKPDATPSGYYPVTAPGDLETQLANVFKDKLSSTSSTASAITTSSYRLSSDTIQFTSEFTQKSWSGDVVAKAISSSGTVGSTLWTAAELLDAKAYADRIIFSYDPSAAKATLFDSPSQLTGDAGELTQVQINNLLSDSGKSGETDANKLTFIQNLINYLRGDRSNEDTLFRKRTHVLGDIVHSTPMYGQSITDKRPFVIVGSNDGMVHVFDAHGTKATNGGKEIFAYVPSQSLRASSNISTPESLAAYAKSDYQTKHRYYVDGDISLATINDNKQRMAFGALGQGGRGIYALDLTDLSKVTTSSASAIVKWEFTHANMGFNQAAPAVVDVNLEAGKTRVVIFSNGFNAPVLPEAGDCGSYPCGTVFVLNAQTGKLLAALTTTAMSGLSEPAVVDKDGDGYADTIYAGDLKGNVWRFDISNAKATSWSNGTKIFTAIASDGVHGQPITSRPSVSKHASGGVMVYFGTGKYLETTDSIASNQTYKESLYGLWDNPKDTSEIKRSSLFARTITDNDTSRFIADSATAIDWSSQRGWYMDLPTTGERIVTNTEYVYGKLNVTTMIPGSDTVNCTNGGKGWLMQLDATTGKSYIQGSDADKATANLQTGGVPSNLNATLVSSGGKLTDTSTTQAHTLQQTSVTNPGTSVGPLTWKQIY